MRPEANILFGILSVVLATLLCWQAARSSASGNTARTIWLLTIAGLILRLFICADGYLHDWDERYHALVASHLAHHPFLPTLYEYPLLPFDYRSWTTNHIWVHKPPVPLWLMAGSIRLFGLHPMAVRLPAILLTTLAIPLVYDIGKRLFSRSIAFKAALLCTIHGLLLDLLSGRQGTDAIDADFFFFVTLAACLAVRHATTGRKSLLLFTGIALGAAILTKWLPALVVLPFWLVLRWQREKRPSRLAAEMFTMAAIASALVIPWQWWIFHRFPAEAAWEQSFNKAHIFTALEGNGGDAWYHFEHLRICYGEAVYAVILLAGWQFIRTRNAVLGSLLLWFGLVYAFFSVVATKMPGYTIFAAPAVWLLTAWTTEAFWKSELPFRLSRTFSRIVAIALIALPIRYTIERLKPFEPLHRGPHPLASPALVSKGIPARKLVLFHAPYPIEEMFFTGCTAYEQDAPKTTKDSLSNQGYTIVTVP
jgi:4-amino-4-deoxy-L-arabinose transferase